MRWMMVVDDGCKNPEIGGYRITVLRNNKSECFPGHPIFLSCSCDDNNATDSFLSLIKYYVLLSTPNDYTISDLIIRPFPFPLFVVPIPTQTAQSQVESDLLI